VPWHICTIHLEAGRACRAKPRCPRGQLGKQLARSARRAQKGTARSNAEDDTQTVPTVGQGNGQCDMRCDTTALVGTGNITDSAKVGTRRVEECQDTVEKKRKKALRTASREARRTAKRAKVQLGHEAQRRLGTIELSDDEPPPGLPADDPPFPIDDDALDDPFDFGEGSLWPDMDPRRDDDDDHLALVAARWKAPKRLKSPPAHHLETLVSSAGASGSGSSKRPKTKDKTEKILIERTRPCSDVCVRGAQETPLVGSRGSHGPAAFVAPLRVVVPEALSGPTWL
jgi:hypothetical protein